MRSSPKPAILALGAALSLAQVVSGATEPKKGKKPPVKPVPAEDSDAPKQPKAKLEDNLNIPVPKGEPQKSVKFPNYNGDGVLDMRFEIGVATRIDEENVKMEKLHIQTYKTGDDGKRVTDMDMDLPDAILNQKSKDITSNTSVNIKSKEYEVTGNAMKFNLETRQGTLGGGVKMIIYDLQTMGGGAKPAPGAKPKPVVEFQKPKPEIKK